MRLLTSILAVFLNIFLAGASPVATAAKIPVGALKGIVIDGRGRAIGGASVTIQTSEGQHPHVARTDASGHFAFVRFETGQYDVRASSRGSYSGWAKRVLIRSRKPTQITLQISLPSP